jgi:hypothetical protein
MRNFAAVVFVALSVATTLSIAGALSVRVRVRDIDGSVLKELVAADVDDGATGGTVMRQLAASGELSWGYVGMGGKDVVTELEGLRARLPLAAWILSHLNLAKDRRALNVGMGDILVEDGDELEWRLTPVGRGLPMPTVLPYKEVVVEEGEEEEEGEEDEEEEGEGGEL